MARGAELNLLCWEGYENPAILGAFAERRGISIHGEILTSDAATAGRLAGGEASRWDIVNLNNPFARDYLYPRGLVRPIDSERFDPCFQRMLPWLADHHDWTRNPDGSERIGICQRFGPFNLVVNLDRVSQDIAEDGGFALTREPGRTGGYAVLAYDDFNIHHICIDAGLDPFRECSTEDLGQFEKTARRWFTNARMVTDDHESLNRALLSGEIDFYLSGGLFTAASARLAGQSQIRCVTPRRGPIDGKGGIAFLEVTSIVDHAQTSPHAEDFLAFVVEPAVAHTLAFDVGSCNPVAQLGDPRCFARCSVEQLDAIQWDALEEDMDRAAQYALTPSHAALLERLETAKREAGWERGIRRAGR